VPDFCALWRALIAVAGDRWREVAVAPQLHRTCPVNYSGAAVAISRSWRVPETPFLGALDSPVNYSEAPLDFPEGEEFSVKSPGAPDTVRWCTGHVRCARPGHTSVSLCSFVEPNSWSFYWLSVNLWHLYNLYIRAKLVSPIICVGQFNHQNQLENRCKPNSLSITKRETIEGELGRFMLHQGEEPQAMYNRLKTLVYQVRNLGSTKWDDHEMVKVILRSIVFLNPTQVQLIHGDPRYKLMSPEEVIGKFVSFELMIKGSKQIIERGATSTPEVQPVAFKATEEKKEESTSSRLPIDASKLDNEEMALIIKSFCQILKQRKGRDYKPRSKKVCYKCGKPGHFIAKCPLSSDSDRGDDKKGKRREKKKYYKKKGGDAHVCQEWDSDEISTDSSSDEDAANIAVTKGLLFPNVGYKCLMARDGKKKVKSRASTKYATSSDEEDNLLTLFANLNMQQKEQLNELISAIPEKDELLDSQEDFLIKENKKHVKVKNSYAQEMEKCEKLTSELSTCHDTISNLRFENDKLIAKVEKLNVSDDSIVNLRNDNANLIAKCRGP
jgi:hypothetical protein